MTTLSVAQIAQIHSQLTERKHLLLGELQRDALSLRESSSRAREPGADAGEQSGADHAASVSASEMARDADELLAIERALERIKHSDYGVCIACNQPIPAARLMANPVALRCVACQAMHERDHPTATPHTL